jgi:acyl carrier protein
MTKEDFLTKLAEMLELDGALSGEETLADLEAWDSMAVLSFMAMADSEAGKTLAPADIAKAKSVADLYALVAG